VVAGGAPCDFRAVPADARSLAFWLGGSRREKPAVYRQASPLARITDVYPPTFFFHGQEDRVVPSDSPRQMMLALREKGVPADLVVLPGVGHVGAYLSDEAPRRAIDFLDRVFADDGHTSR
jgi:triacylglycerol lipase